MKILQICNKVPYPPIDGGAIATFSMSQSFISLGHQVDILAMNTTKHYYDINNIPGNIKKDINFYLVDVKADIKLSGLIGNLIFSRLPYNAVRFIDETFNDKLKRILKNNQYDVIQLEGLYLSPYIGTIKHYSNALIALRAHNIEHEIWQRVVKQEHALIKKYYLKNLTKRLKKFEISYINEYDVLIPITKRDENVFMRLGNTKPALTTNTGIDTGHLKPDYTNREFPSLFHIGSLDWAPNQEGLKWFFSQVWPELNQKHPTLKIYIAGRNAPLWIEKLFESIPNLVYLGEVDNAYEFMNSKSIMIVPLLSGSGMRIKIIEGMALAKTIVSTDIGAEGIDSTHNENILIADKGEAFVTEIDKLVKDITLCNKIGNNAVEFIQKHFELNHITKKLTDFYQSQLK